MKLRDLDFNDKDDWLKMTDLEILFDVFKDKRDKYVYNLNKTIYINVDSSCLAEYICTIDMFWPLISYKLYGTTRLVWLLLKINNVGPDKILDIKHAGDVIKYLPKDTARTIVEDINSMDEE